jgi:succinate-acetate transporter protein
MSKLAVLPDEACMSALPPSYPDTTKGVTFGLTAYLMWGCFPFFFALFEGVPALERQSRSAW